MIDGFKKTLIGDIPTNWELKKFIQETELLTCGVAATPTYVDEKVGIPFLSAQNVKDGKVVLHKYKYISKLHHQELTKNNKPKKGDILYSRVGAKFGEAGVVEHDFEFSVYVSLTHIRVKTTSDPYFIKFLLNSNYVKNLARSSVFQGAGVPNLNVKVVRDFLLAFPPLPEQQKIAKILSTVDDKIEVVDQQIIETQALKKGLMQRLLTKGIGHTEFKDSNLGMIPKSWEVVPIYELRNKNDRYGFTGGPFGSDLKSEHYTEIGVKIIQLQNIGEGKFIDKGIAFTSEKKADELHSCNIYPNEIILAKMAPVARCCKVPSTDERYVMCSDGIRLSVDANKYDNEFVFQALNSKYFRDEAESKSTGTTRARIGLKELKLIPILIPKDIQEQKEVAIVLRTVDEKLEILLEKKIHFKELKQGLMQQLLTGKIRVKV
ncbi:EcoKI restriction-modification system protein HsdS [compost metagenome]